jgi:Brp/Blh family beta-carotene 15,15'-monooxygenase
MPLTKSVSDWWFTILLLVQEQKLRLPDINHTNESPRLAGARRFSIMTKATFVFISCVLLSLPLVLSAGQISIETQLLICTPFILILGIPHGAIDNTLYLRNNTISNTAFISSYLVLIAANIAIWIFLPALAYLIFLLLSAYHFGQSQFSHHFSKTSIAEQALFLFWGGSLLTGFVYFNHAEISSIINNNIEFSVFRNIHGLDLTLYLLVALSTLTLFLLGVLFVRKLIKLEAILMEILVLLLVMASFYLMQLLIGFSLYFIILHSFKVLREEYNFLKKEEITSSLFDFTKLIAPFTILSIFGILFLYGLIYFDFLGLSYGYGLLVIISSITLPHVFVMNRFYNLLSRKNLVETMS